MKDFIYSGNEVWFGLIALWVLPWKGVALWKAAQRKEQAWFIALLIVNTVGLLEMFYVLYWTKRRSSPHHMHKVHV